MILFPLFGDQDKVYRVFAGTVLLLANVVVILLATWGLGIHYFLVLTVVLLANGALAIFRVPIEGWFWHWMTAPFPSFEDKRRDATKLALTKHGRYMWGCKWYKLAPEVEEWCRINCRGAIGIRPEINDLKDRRIIWFTRRDDALHFKLRWG